MASGDEFGRLARIEGVPSALTAARDAADVILRDRGRRATTPEVTAEALLRGAAASASLDGSTSTLDELRSGDADDIAIAAARLNAELLSLVPIAKQAPVRAFARIHALAAAGRAGPEALGRPRAAAGPARHLLELGDRLVRPTEAPALAVAALAHAEIATAEPFEVANAMVARALERLILVVRGVDPASVLVPEAGHAGDPDGYRAALNAYATATPDGRRAWLLYAASAFTRSLAASPVGGN